MRDQPIALQFIIKQDLPGPTNVEELTPSEAEVGEMVSADNDELAGAAAVEVAVALREDEEGCLLLWETVRETDGGVWVLFEDTEADVTRVLLEDTEVEAGSGTALVAEIPDVNEVAGETVVEAEDGINKEAGGKTKRKILFSV